MSEPLVLPRNCSNCAHWDGDCHCALPRLDAPIVGAIVEPESVVCLRHEAPEPEPLDGDKP